MYGECQKDVLNFLPMDLLQEEFEIPQEKMNLAFEDMTIGDFYEYIFMGIDYLEGKKDYTFHEKIDVFHTRYDRNGIPNKKPRI